MALDWIEPRGPRPPWVPDYFRDYTIAPLHPNEESGTEERYLVFDPNAPIASHHVWLYAKQHGVNIGIRLVSCLEDAEQIVKAIGRQMEALLLDHEWSQDAGFRARRLAAWLATWQEE